MGFYRLNRRFGVLVTVLCGVLLAACGAPHLTPPPPSKVDVATPEMVALKAKTHIADCPKPQAAGGVT